MRQLTAFKMKFDCLREFFFNSFLAKSYFYYLSTVAIHAKYYFYYFLFLVSLYNSSKGSPTITIIIITIKNVWR